MQTEGGATEKEAIFRMLRALIGPEIQTKINRTGIGKEPLHMCILELIEGKKL